MARNSIIREHPPKIPTPTDETVEAHYASLERLECARCFGGYLTITVEEDGQERDEAGYAPMTGTTLEALPRSRAR